MNEFKSIFDRIDKKLIPGLPLEQPVELGKDYFNNDFPQLYELLMQGPEFAALKRLQDLAIVQYHITSISAAKGLKLSCGLEFKRGDPGGLLDPKAINLFNPDHQAQFRKNLALGATLCYFNSWILTLPSEYIRVKKSKTDNKTLNLW